MKGSDRGIEGEWEGRERGTEGGRECETKGGSEGRYYKGREGVVGGRERERKKGREGRKEVWRVKRKGRVGRVLQREGGCGRRVDGVGEGGKGEMGGRGYGG